MDPIDNHSIADAAEVVFANSSAYVVELPIVGRESEAETLLEALRDDGRPRAVTISAPLGAGKTFFLSSVFGQLSRSNPEFDEHRDRKEILATDVLTPDEVGLDATPNADAGVLSEILDLEALFGDQRGRQVLVIEEIDRKATLAQIRWCVAAGTRWLQEGENRTLVVTGDQTINGRHVQKFLNGVSLDHVTLGPLNLSLLTRALEARIEEKLLKPRNPNVVPEELRTLARRAAEEILADDFIRWASVPSTNPPMLATFRDALGILRGFAQNAPSHQGDVLFGRELVGLIPTFRSGLATKASALEAALEAEVRTRILREEAIPAYSTEELASLINADGGPEFEKRVVRLLARKSLLMPIGIPYELPFDEGAEPDSLAGPFVPSYRLIHNTLLSLLRAP